MGVVVTVVVEYVFRRVHPTTDLTEGIEDRLKMVENDLRSAAAGQPLDTVSEKRLSLYASVGTSRLRRLILRSQYSLHFKAQMGAAVALVGQLVDVTANFQLALVERAKKSGQLVAQLDPADKARLQHLAGEVEMFCKDLGLKRLPGKIQRPAEQDPSKLPFLSAMERIVALIPEAFSGSTKMGEFVTAPLDEEEPKRFFARDTFSNPAHVQFALRGTLAAFASYIIYTAIDWPGLSTCMATCIITALSTIGSSRQKQFLRLGGVIVGGIIIGFGAQMFVLPYLDSITGFTLLFMFVTALSAWIATSSPRLSYLGVQLALAFYLINLQEFTIQTSLSIARDRVFGVLLGLMMMWLIYDRLWVKSALDEMQTIFARNLEMFAELTEQLLEKDQVKAIKRIRQLRDQLNSGFPVVTAQGDAVLFEFGPSRQRQLQIRDDVRRWQPSLRTLLQVQIASVQYLQHTPLGNLPEPIAQAGVAFEKDVAQVMHAMASEASGKPVAGVPDISLSAAQFQDAIRKYYQDAGTPVPTQASDVLGLAESLATIIGPLYEDIRDTFAAHQLWNRQPHPIGARAGLTSARSRCVLSFSIAERPIFLRHFDQVDQDIFFAQLEAFVQAIGHRFVKTLLHLDRSAAVQGDLQKYAVVRSVDAKIIRIKLQAGFGMRGDDLEQVVFWDVQNFRHRPGHDQANLNSVLRCFPFKEVNANDRHAVSSDEFSRSRLLPEVDQERDRATELALAIPHTCKPG